jgi:hypothetical protein
MTTGIYGKPGSRKRHVTVKTEKEARLAAPWAKVIAPDADGYWCFEDVDDYRVWLSQR